MAGALWVLAKVRAYTRLSGAERRAAVRAFGGLLVWRIALSLLPWRLTQRWVVRRSPSARRVSDDWPLIVQRALGRAGRLQPGASCLVQALAGAAMLRRGGHPATICIGVRRDDGSDFGAHAWVKCGDTFIAGEVAQLESYRELLRIEDAAHSASR